MMYYILHNGIMASEFDFVICTNITKLVPSGFVSH